MHFNDKIKEQFLNKKNQNIKIRGYANVKSVQKINEKLTRNGKLKTERF